MEQIFENVINNLTDLKNQCRHFHALLVKLQYDIEILAGYLTSAQNLREEFVAGLKKKVTFHYNILFSLKFFL